MIRALLEAIGLHGTPRTAEQWVARSQSRRLSAAEARRLQQWLSIETNKREFERVRGIAQWGAYLRARPDVASKMTVYPMLSPSPRPNPRREAETWKPNGRMWPQLTVLAAGAACVAVALLLIVPRMSPIVPTGSVATARGEQRTVVLDDGSQMVVNTDSSLQVSYSEGERRVLLTRGEAFFDVVKDPSGRAFVVQAGNTEVRVLGTKFSVRATGSRTDVIVSEGKVEVVPNAVRSSPAEPAKVELVPGNALRIDRDESQVRIAAVDPERATAWRTGTLFFDDMALEDVVGELNRYSAQAFVISDERIRDIRMSGAFRIGDNAAVRFALKDAFGINATYDGDRILLR
jgi:transmembrane sensor